MIVYVESNYLLEIAFWQEQHGPCLSLLHYAEARRIDLALPAYCFGECLERLGRRKAKRLDVQTLLREDIRELGRSPPNAGLAARLQDITDALVSGAEVERSEYQELVERHLRTAILIPLDAEVLRRSFGFRDRFGLTSQDAIVLASVVAHIHASRPAKALFINKNRKDFENPDLQAELRQWNCELKTDFRAGLGALEAGLRSA